MQFMELFRFDIENDKGGGSFCLIISIGDKVQDKLNNLIVLKNRDLIF